MIVLEVKNKYESNTIHSVFYSDVVIIKAMNRKKLTKQAVDC